MFVSFGEYGCLKGCRHCQEKGEEDGAHTKPKVDLALPLQLSSYSSELQRDIDRKDNQTEWGKQVMEGEVECVESVNRRNVNIENIQ